MILRVKIYIIAGFAFLCNTLNLQAQDHGFFDHIWLEQGLSQSSISSIVQDKKGYMWFGTQDGLNRYDGRQIDQFNFQSFNPQSISGDNIFSSSVDKLDNLWIVSGGGLDKMNLQTFKVIHINEKIKSEPGKAITIGRVWCLNNKIYLNTSDGFVELIENKNNEYVFLPFDFETDETNFKPTMLSLCANDQGQIYAGTNRGIFYFDETKKSFLPLKVNSGLNDSKNKIPLLAYTVFWKKDKLYFSLNNLFYCYNTTTAKTTSLTLNKESSSLISSGVIDRQNNIWIGTDGNGLFRITINENDSLKIEKHFNKNDNSRFGLITNAVSSLYQNANSIDDIVWIGSRDAGIFNYSYSKNSFSLPSSTLDKVDPNFYGIVKDKDGVIWSGMNFGLCKINSATKKADYIDLRDEILKAQRPIEALCCDENNTVWAGLGNSLYKIDKVKNKLELIADALVSNGKRNHVLKIVELNKNELLIGCWQGLIIYNQNTGATTLQSEIKLDDVSQKFQSVSSIFVDSKQNWWFGSLNGLYYMDKKTGHNFHYKNTASDSSSLLANSIMDINETNKGEIIVATTKGLSLLKNTNGNSGFLNFYSKKELANNFIYGLLRDNNGNFWMSTNFGITVFDPINYSFKNYNATDGLCINEFNSGGFHKAFDGELVFGGIGALVSIYPEKQIVNKNEPYILLRALQIDDVPFDTLLGMPKNLKLKYNENKLHFEFSVPDFSGAKNIRLFYRFKGMRDKWTEINPSGIFNLVFAGLAPGNYNMEVKAVTSEGVESQPFLFSFIVDPPFWNTWWFYLFTILIALLSSGMIYRIRLNNKINRLRQEENIRKEENEKVRKAAALDLHDEFGNGLTRISMLVEMARIKVVKENKEANQLLDVIAQNSSRLYQGTKDFIWSINPGNDNLYEVIIRIKDFADELFYGTGTNFEVRGLSDELKNKKELPGTGRNIAMIFKEGLSNVLKHAKASNVLLQVEQNHEHFIITLRDNGVGFELKENKNSFGLANMQQRTSRVGAQLNVNSHPRNGTEIILTLNK